MIIPYVIEKKDGTERSMDIYSRLLEDRIIVMHGEITGDRANAVSAQLLYLAAKDKKSDIRMYIDSPGGSVSAGLSVLDTMNFIAPDVSTVCMGTAASMGAVLLCGGAKGKRFILPHGQVMIHQPLIGSGGLSGQCSDIKIHADNLVKMRDTIEQILSEATGQDIKRIHRDCDRDNYFSASEAVEYGLCDKIITKQQ